MLLLAIVAITTLAANSARQLRYTAVAFFAVALAAHLIDDGTLAAAQVLISAAAALSTTKPCALPPRNELTRLGRPTSSKIRLEGRGRY